MQLFGGHGTRFVGYVECSGCITQELDLVTKMERLTGSRVAANLGHVAGDRNRFDARLL